MAIAHAAALWMLLALIGIAPQVSMAETTETVGPMTVVMPTGWTRQPTDPISFYVAEASAQGQDVSQVFLNSVVQPGANQAAVHQVIWNQMLQQEARPKRQSNGSFGRFTWSQMEVASADGARSEYNRLYTTQSANTHVVVLLAASSKTIFEKSLPVVERALASAKFSGEPAAMTSVPRESTAVPASSNVPGLPAKDIPITEAHVRLDIRSVTQSSNVLTDHLLFFQNGIVVREGVITAPRVCYATIPAADLTVLPNNYGRWRENKAAGQVTIQWQEGPPWTLQRDGDRLSLEGKKLLKYRSLDGLKLDGTFVHRSLTGTNVTLALRRNGSFEANGLMEEMLCPTPAGRLKLSGAGTYEVRKWTLILRFSSGEVLLLPISVLSDEDLQSVSKFSLRSSYDFVKAR